MAQYKVAHREHGIGGADRLRPPVGAPTRQRSFNQNLVTLRRLKKAAKDADEGNGTNLTHLSHAERMKALFGE